MLLCMTVVLAVPLSACGGAGSSKRVVVGSKDFTEQHLLGWMTVIALEQSGFTVVNQVDLGGTLANREALLDGQIDLYWEYTGTAWLLHLGHEAVINDPQTVYELVKAEDESQGLIWLDYAHFNNTYTLMMEQVDADEAGVQTISDLVEYWEDHPAAVLCSNEEWTVRPDGFLSLKEVYGLPLAVEEIRVMEIAQTYRGLGEGECDVALGFATDGRIPAWGLTTLADNRGFFPVYNPAPVVRAEVLGRHPEIAGILNSIATSLDGQKMTSMNSVVDVGPDLNLGTGDERDPEQVACNFLINEGLVESCGE